MMDIFKCIIGILIPFFGTSFGAAVVFIFRKNISTKMQNIFLAFASGIMFAASIWSLIIPAVNMQESKLSSLLVSIGILLGAGFLVLSDLFFKKNKNTSQTNTNNLAFAITLHNIPEGMAVGIAFASALSGNFGMELVSSLMLSIGIAIQNFPEGMAISLPLKSSGFSNKKSFLCGVLSRSSRTHSCSCDSFD